MRDDIVIRSETRDDYCSIARVHAAAFTHALNAVETALVDVHRHSASFLPELSLVAESAGEVVGHVLFSLRQIRIGGGSCLAGILAPLAVMPPYQRLGIGERLIREGHRRVRELGGAFSMLLGHASYYPRFGYQTGMFGTCEIQVNREDVLKASATDSAVLKERRVTEEDIPALTTMWNVWFHDVDLAIQPEPSILDWVSIGKGVSARVFLDGGECIGYIRSSASDAGDIRCFLARDQAAAMRMLANVFTGSPELERLTVPVHPDCEAVQKFVAVPFDAEVRVWDAAMIHVLDREKDSIVRYCDEVSQGARKNGLVIWPAEFDVC